MISDQCWFLSTVSKSYSSYNCYGKSKLLSEVTIRFLFLSLSASESWQVGLSSSINCCSRIPLQKLTSLSTLRRRVPVLYLHFLLFFAKVDRRILSTSSKLLTARSQSFKYLFFRKSWRKEYYSRGGSGSFSDSSSISWRLMTSWEGYSELRSISLILSFED